MAQLSQIMGKDTKKVTYILQLNIFSIQLGPTQV